MANCPPTDTLAALLNGDLADDAIVTLGEHIETCEHCITKLEQLTPREQSVLPDASSEHDPFVMEPQCKQLIERLQRTNDTQPDPVKVGPYRIIERIGFGGVGAVYKAEHSLLGKVVALKVLKDAGNEESTARFLREMRATGQLKHPNIVQATDGGIDDGRHYFVMEYLEGLNLSDLSAAHGPLAIANACELIRQTAVGLAHIHEAGLVHRDLKPRNLILAKTDRGVEVKILDLGLASVRQALVPDESLTQTGQVMGTLDYMAPEQALDSHDVDIRADIYALGATLYKLLCGQAPFQSASYNTFGRKFNALLSQSPDPIGDRRSDLPAQIVEVLERMMHREPEERFRTPAEVVQAVSSFCDEHDLPTLLDSPDVAAQETCVAAETMTVASVDSSTAETFVGSRREESPTLPATEIDSKNRTSVRRLLTIAGGLLGAIVLGAVLYIQMGKATLIVRIADPAFSACVVSDGIEIHGGESPIKLAPGQHRLRVSRGDFSFETDNFRLSRGEKEVLSVELVEGSVNVVRDGEAISSKTLPTRISAADDVSSPVVYDQDAHDRAAAEWVVERGGRILVDGVDSWLSEVPEGSFRIVEILFDAETPIVTDLTGGEILNGLQSLERIALFDFGDDFVEMLDDLPALDGMVLINSDSQIRPKFTDRSLGLLNRYPRLERFVSEGTDITIAGLIQLVQSAFGERLHSLTANGVHVTDDFMMACGKLKSLRILGFNYSSGVTVTGLESLQNSSLTMLNLCATPLTPDCIQAIAQIKTLEYLNCGNDQLTFDDLSPVRDLAELVCLHIPHVRGDRAQLDEFRQLIPEASVVSDFGEDLPWARGPETDRAVAEWLLTNSPNVEIQINGDGERFQNVKDLPVGELRLTHIRSSDAASLAKVPMFDFNEIQRLNGLSHLTSIICYFGMHDEALEKIGDLPALTELSLAGHPNPEGSPQVTNRSVALLNRYPNLKWLSLAHTRITDEAMGRLFASESMQNLEQVMLSGTDAGREALTSLVRLPKLWELRIENCEKAMQELHLLSNSNLKSLNLYGNLLTDDVAKKIQTIVTLELLNVDAAAGSPEQVIGFAQMPNMQRILCNSPQLTDADIDTVLQAVPDFKRDPQNPRQLIRRN